MTIGIPTLDRLNYLREAVASARAQTAPDIEIVIGDDGDSAELRSWCLGQVAADARVRYEKTPRRLGLAGNWNFVAGLARRDYLTLIGDDDRLLPAFIERVSAAADPDAAVVFSNHYLIDKAGNRLEAESIAATRRYARSTLRPGPLEHPATHVWRNGVPMCASIVRTSEVRRLGFKNDINTPELELFVRLAGEGARFVFVDEYLVEFRTHAGSATSAGLTVDRLAEYLEAVSVPPDVQPVKRDCLRQLLVAGTAVRVARADIAGARRLMASPYYPRTIADLHGLAQRALLTLPDRAVRPAYAALRRLRNALRREG